MAIAARCHVIAFAARRVQNSLPDTAFISEQTSVIPTGAQWTSLCLALEDSHHGVRSASSAGMMTIMVPDLLPATDELCTLCLHVVPDLYEVHRVLVASRQAA